MHASHTMNELLQSNIIYYIGCTWICHKSLIWPKPILILQVLQNKTKKNRPKCSPSLSNMISMLSHCCYKTTKIEHGWNLLL